jgi:hypothetical protein
VYGSENEVLIVAATGFRGYSVEFLDIDSCVTISVVRLTYFLHWHEVESPNSKTSP